MTTYSTFGPDASGQFVIGYPTPGAPRIFTAVACANTKVGAESACARLNEQKAHTARVLAADRTARFRRAGL